MDENERIQPRDTPYMSNEALASDPGGVTIDPQRLRQLSPSFFGLGALLPTRAIARKILAAHMWNGDSRAGVALSVHRCSCRVQLRLRRGRRAAVRPASRRQLRPGRQQAPDRQHLLPRHPGRDILRGSVVSPVWANFYPVIADFVAADPARVERRKAAISEPEWQRTWDLGQDYLVKRPGKFRDGAPHRSDRPAS